MSKLNGPFRNISHYCLLIITGRISRFPGFLEFGLISAFIFGLVFLYRDFLFESVTFNHDSILWYGMFHYFVESLINGSWPYWNPYVHGGEPFFYAWNIIRLTDPVTLFLVFVAAPFDPDLFSLYHFNFIIRIVVASVGSYLFLRSLLTRIVSLISTSLLVLWVPLGGQSLAIIGNLDAYCWFPWFLWCLIKLLNVEPGGPACRRETRKWLLLAAWFFGIMVGGAIYHWAYGLYIIFLFLITFAFLNWKFSKQIVLQNKIPCAAGLILIAMMTSPLAVLYFEKGEIYPAAREIHRSQVSNSVLGVNYKELMDRSPQIGFGSLKSVKALFTFNSAQGIGNYAGGDDVGVWMFGKIATIFLLLGIFCGKHRFRWPLLVAMCGCTLMWVGPQPYFGWLYKLLYLSFPPLWLTRHQSLFEPFCALLFASFVGLGIDRLHELIKSKRLRDGFSILMFGCLERERRNHLKRVFFSRNLALSAGIVGAVIFLVFGHSNVARAGEFHDHASIITGLAIGAAVFFAFFLSNSIRVAIFCIPAFLFPSILILQIVEQGKLSMHTHRATAKCLHSWKCNFDYYFDDFTIPRKAVDGFVLPEKRNVGLNMPKSYFSYAPAIFKNNVALEDIMPASPPPFGSGHQMNAHFAPTNFPLGLYHFWLKDYLRVYEIGEWQPETFSALMGIGQPLIDFKTHYALYPPPHSDRSGLADPFWKRADQKILSKILSRFAVIETDEPFARNSGNIRDVFSSLSTSKQAVIKSFSKELFLNTNDKTLPPDWVFHGPRIPGWGVKKIQDGSGPSGNALLLPAPKSSHIMARFNTDKLASVPKGKCEVRVEVWVKSNNKTRDSVTVDIQTKRNVGPVTLKGYSNSGEWEKLVLNAFLDESADYILVTLYVRDDATASAQFADVSIDVVEQTNQQFEHRLERKFGVKKSSSFELTDTSFSPNKLKLEVITKEPGILIYRDLWTKDWEGYVNGQKAPLVKVNIAFKGIALPAGKHQVILNYRPAWFIASFYAYLAGLIAGGFYCIVVLLRLRQPKIKARVTDDTA